jgi:snoRNA binding domain, fibrillarin
VGTAVLVADGPRIGLVDLTAAPPAPEFLIDPDPVRAAGRFLELRPSDLPSGLLDAVGNLPESARVVSGNAALGRALMVRWGRTLAPASTEELRAARSLLARGPPHDDRGFLLALARLALDRALRSPEEVLISLAREEERLERSLGREERAAAAFLPVPGTPLADYLVAWDGARGALARHHEGLVLLLERSARDVVPNLSAVVGEKVAARLVAIAGGRMPLGRMNASRLQLLGTRRRPSPERGPRFGVIYRSVRMDEVPVARRGAYARSLAALAVIAARADATTGRSLAAGLVARRDRRVDRLRGRSP